MTIKYIEIFPTIDLCVEYLRSQGCINTDLDDKLSADMYYKHKDIIVFYDPHLVLYSDNTHDFKNYYQN